MAPSFQLVLDSGVAQLTTALTTFLRMNPFIFRVLVSPEEVVFIATGEHHPLHVSPTGPVCIRVRRSAFSVFTCDSERRFGFSVQFVYLYPFLAQHTSCDCLEMTGGGSSNYFTMCLSSHGDTEEGAEVGHLCIIKCEELGHLDISELEYQFPVLVEMPSHEFRRVIADLARDRTTQATVLVTNSQVSFSAGDVQTILLTELQQCSIFGADESGDPISFKFSLRLKEAILHAASLSVSASVGLLGEGEGEASRRRVMLQCPIRGLGSFIFYFN